MKKNERARRFQWPMFWMIMAVVLVVVGSCLAMLPLTRMLSTQEGQRYIIEKMQRFGIFAPLLFVFLQVLQVVIAIIPGGPVPIIGGVLFGEWGALVLCLAGFFLGTVLVYYLVQWIGKPIVDRFVSEKHFRKFDFLMQGKRLELFVFLAFLLPGLPKDMLTYLISFNPRIKPMHLFFLTTLGRAPATVLTVFLGSSLWDGNYQLAIILFLVMALLGAAGFFLKHTMDKREKAKVKHQHSKEKV